MAKVLVSKNEITGGTALTQGERDLLPAAYAIRFLMQAACGVSRNLKKDKAELMKPVLDAFPDAEYVAELMKLENICPSYEPATSANRFPSFFTVFGSAFFSRFIDVYKRQVQRRMYALYGCCRA